jgi:site-specific DNA-methyltransferase (adenine-specific)
MQTARAYNNEDAEKKLILLHALELDGVVILPPCDVIETLELLDRLGIYSQCTMLDPWYNKGAGGTRDDYEQFIDEMLLLAKEIADHIYLWGFPEIIAHFVDRLPEGMHLKAWLTWFYPNCPSVIRGWRSAQNACLHISKPTAMIYPEHFLNEAQQAKKAQGKLRYLPGPPSVIEAPLDIPTDVIKAALAIGFVGKKEQTGHPSQKPFKVYEQLVLMATEENDLIIDPMAGSGTTGDVARRLNRKAILCDLSEEYTKIMEKRLGVRRLQF